MPVIDPEPTFRPSYAVPPGATIADLLEERDMTQTDLARRLGVTPKHVNQVVSGAASISAELSLGLEKVFRVPADFWLSRDSLYRADLARRSERKELEAHIGWAKHFPIKELKQRDYIPVAATGADLVAALLRFLGIATPHQWEDPAVAYRKSVRYESDPYALAAWLRAGELDAAAIQTEPYDHHGFLDALSEARGLTRLDPKQWHPRLVELFAAVGVAVVVVDTFERARANGATRWLAPNKALIQLSLRYRWEDIFWFTLFHEAGHVVLHRKKDLFVDGLTTIDSATAIEWHRLEDEANRFAARTLIPAPYEQRLPALAVGDVKQLADHLGIAPAIIVGRMQHEHIIGFSQWNHLRRRFTFTD